MIQQIIKTIAQDRYWYEQRKTQQRSSILEIAQSKNIDASDISRSLPLAFLAPANISDIVSGNQPIDLSAKSLKRKTAHLPIQWNEQRAYLGFAV